MHFHSKPNIIVKTREMALIMNLIYREYGHATSSSDEECDVIKDSDLSLFGFCSTLFAFCSEI